MRRLKWTVLALILGLTLLGMSSTRTAQAKSLSFKALTYGTTKTSIASAYFVHPASVTVHNHQYVVTMHIRTAKKLSAFPVKVLQVNGRTPQRVRRVTDKAGNSNVYYSFTTKSLAKVINAKLAINVPKVYKATHMISFKFSQAHLPSLKTTRHANASTEPVRQITDSSSDTVTQANQTSQASSHRLKTISGGTTPTSSSTSQSVGSRKTQASTRSTATSTQSQAQNTPSQSSQSQASSSVTVASADHADQSATPLNWWFLIGGVTVIVIMVVGGGLVIVGRHGRGR